MNTSFLTFGCKVNQYETQAMLNLVTSAGFSVCDNPLESDVVVINSCTVTAVSDHKVRQALHRIRRENPSAVIVLTGCMTQAFPKTAEILPEADIILGNSSRASLVKHLQEYFKNPHRIVDIAPQRTDFEPLQVTEFYERTRAFVKIEDGCNRFCSYCIIPYARGRVRSKPLDELTHEIEAIAANGYREIVLTGINLSAYGQKIGLTLCDAVEAACAPESVARVRLGSLEPERMEKDVIARMNLQKKLCPQFHLSLQSGCDATLKRMNRHYTAGEYLNIAEDLRAAFPNAAITTDIMVGFPGETEEEFSESLRFAEKVRFAKAHVFMYSRRPGTEADKMPDQVPEQVKETRSRAMIEATVKTRREFLASQAGLTEDVLFEREFRPGVYEGYTANYTPVHAASNKNICGEILPAHLFRAADGFCEAELVRLI